MLNPTTFEFEIYIEITNLVLTRSIENRMFKKERKKERKKKTLIYAQMETKKKWQQT